MKASRQKKGKTKDQLKRRTTLKKKTTRKTTKKTTTKRTRKSTRKKTNMPHIDSISPSTTKKDTEFPMTVLGLNFDDQSRVMVEARVRETKFVSDIQLEAGIIKEDTSTSGKQVVLVHQMNTGTISNEKILTVE